MTSWSRVVLGCGGLNSVLALTPDYLNVLDSMGGGAEEWEVVAALKVPRTPAEVCELSRLGDFRVCQTLWALRVLGGVKILQAHEVEQEAVEQEAVEQEVVAPEPVEQEAVEAAAMDEEDDVVLDLGEVVDEPVATVERDAIAEAIRRVPDLVEDEDEDEDGVETETDKTEDDKTIRVTWKDVEPAEVDESVEEPAIELQDIGIDDADDVDDGWAPPIDLEQAIQRFNAMHRLIYRSVRAEVGAGAANVIRACCGAIDERTPLYETDLLDDGSWDSEGLRKAVVELRLEDPWGEYRQLIDREIEFLRGHLGGHRIVELEQLVDRMTDS